MDMAENKEKQDNKTVHNSQKKAQKNTDKQDKEIARLKESLEELTKRNEELSRKVEEEKNDYLRLMAEFETFRRRSAQDRLDLVGSASAETIKGLLPTLDDCERAMALLEGSADEAAKEGTALIYNKLLAYLKSRGLERIEAKGEKFDTDFHEAVAQVPVEDKALKGLVYDVIETGYLLGGKVLRYAKVVVGA